jgi:hypothetical protein
MRLARLLVRGRGAVAGEHRPAPPARQAHEIVLVAAAGEPLVGVRVRKRCGVDIRAWVDSDEFFVFFTPW